MNKSRFIFPLFAGVKTTVWCFTVCLSGNHNCINPVWTLQINQLSATRAESKSPRLTIASIKPSTHSRQEQLYQISLIFRKRKSHCHGWVIKGRRNSLVFIFCCLIIFIWLLFKGWKLQSCPTTEGPLNAAGPKTGSRLQRTSPASSPTLPCGLLPAMLKACSSPVPWTHHADSYRDVSPQYFHHHSYSSWKKKLCPLQDAFWDLKKNPTSLLSFHKNFYVHWYHRTHIIYSSTLRMFLSH